MKKSIALICAAVMCMTMVMTGCGKKTVQSDGQGGSLVYDPQNTMPAPETTEAVSETVSDEIDLANYPDASVITSPEEGQKVMQAIKDKYEPQTVAVGEMEVQLPATLSELYAAGWTLSSDTLTFKGGEAEDEHLFGMRHPSYRYRGLQVTKYYNLALKQDTESADVQVGTMNEVDSATGLSPFDELVVVEAIETVNPNLVTICGVELLKKSSEGTEEEYKAMVDDLVAHGLVDITDECAGLFDEASTIWRPVNGARWYRDPETNTLYEIHAITQGVNKFVGYIIRTSEEYKEFLRDGAGSANDELRIAAVEKIEEHFAN